MPLIPFLDTHVHFWDHRVDGLRWPWLEKGFTSHLHSWTTATARERLDELHQRESFTVPEFEIEAAGAGVCGIIHAHAATARRSDCDETAWLDRMAASHGWPLAMIGRCDLVSPDGPALLRRHREASARCTSVRDMNGPKGIDVDACAATLRVAAELGFAVELRTPPENFDMFVRFAECHPDVTFVMSHASLPLERSAASLATYRARSGTGCRLAQLGLQGLSALRRLGSELDGRLDSAVGRDLLRPLRPGPGDARDELARRPVVRRLRRRRQRVSDDLLWPLR